MFSPIFLLHFPFVADNPKPIKDDVIVSSFSGTLDEGNINSLMFTIIV